MKLMLAWLCYQLGDIISITLMRFGIGYSLYNKLMLFSGKLDDKGVIWK